MKIAQLGEAKILGACVGGLPRSTGVHVGIGDDCAVVRAADAAMWQLLKVDAVVEGIHFRTDADWRQVGWKAVCRAVSDVAAMGGKPVYALVTVALSPGTEFARLKTLYAGIRRACRRFGAALIGGETSRSPGPLFVNVAMTGVVERERCVTRSGGAPGDLLYVTGRLGGSLRGKHLTFTPRVAEARWLVAHFPVHAMIDLSDGLGADLPTLAAASRCAFTLRSTAIPRTRGCSLAQAIGDGEDYELLFSLPSHFKERLERAWRKKFPRVPLTSIGALTRKTRVTGKNRDLRGYDHFA